MIIELLQRQRELLNPYFDRIDSVAVERILAHLLVCKGTLVFSGVGKSGHIAQKIAATFMSTGTKAFFLDPTHAIHGDLGIVGAEDICVAFSKSGESLELLELLFHIKQRGAKVIGFFSKERCKLRELCDDFLLLPVEQELCPYDLAPTISTAVQLLFGDCLAIALMKKKKVTLEQYAQNHPGGLIGKKLSLKVKHLMLQGEALPLAFPEERLADVLSTLSAKRCGCLLVVDRAKTLLGIFTDGDLRRALEKRGALALEVSLAELIAKKQPVVISPEALASSALQLMEQSPTQRIMMLPVVDEGRLVGLLQMHDIIQAGLKE